MKENIIAASWLSIHVMWYRETEYQRACWCSFTLHTQVLHPEHCQEPNYLYFTWLTFKFSREDYLLILFTISWQNTLTTTHASIIFCRSVYSNIPIYIRWLPNHLTTNTRLSQWSTSILMCVWFSRWVQKKTLSQEQLNHEEERHHPHTAT